MYKVKKQHKEESVALPHVGRIRLADIPQSLIKTHQRTIGKYFDGAPDEPAPVPTAAQEEAPANGKGKSKNTNGSPGNTESE